MRDLIYLAVLPLLLACTTIHSAGSGDTPGEIYVTTQTSYLIFTESRLLRCSPDSDGWLSCTSVLTGSQAGVFVKIARTTEREYMTWYRKCEAIGNDDASRQLPKAASVQVADFALSVNEQMGCDDGYSEGYDTYDPNAPE